MTFERTRLQLLESLYLGRFTPIVPKTNIKYEGGETGRRLEDSKSIKHIQASGMEVTKCEADSPGGQP